MMRKQFNFIIEQAFIITQSHTLYTDLNLWMFQKQLESVLPLRLGGLWRVISSVNCERLSNEEKILYWQEARFV